MTIKRGAIYTMAAKGAYTGKPRPAIVIQNEEIPLDSVVVIPTTTQWVDAPWFRIEIDPTAENGLAERTYAMSDKIVTIPKSNLGKKIGHLDEDRMKNLEDAIREVIGLN
ncbi:mRNA interferase MazF [Sinorhizobium terangae]|uniref:Type II toxin-antitoxin system PemK/MazF family toxin n=1 Tax=Sinorhizobium terangae TaxID=110322 RepID=A0A6N7LCJ8_SINTE|nr:type II toxin-antitoxin system PemK/MazF family toxin [Sinorhizobium terangae]MBB4187330.1 mRNA interferase MazF [Sinorhizobium terangae]MQX14655.1 type II toxin-antitoxin system PemK/MazF family toxin [Sinorhizobium terangae]